MSSPSTTDEFSDLRQAFGSVCKKKLVEEVDKLKEAVQQDDPHKVIMAVPMLLALTICPAMLGTQEAIRQSQAKSRREEHRGRRCNLIVSCVKPSLRSRDIHNKLVVLKDSKLYIANGLPTDDDEPTESVRDGYPFSGYFLPYPDSEYEGLVSTISDVPPMLNWIYVDSETYEVKYGVRDKAQPNITGPFDCTKQDRRMTLEGWEGFVAVEELPGTWALYFDRDDDGLTTKVPMGTRVLEVELIRREKKEPKPENNSGLQPMTLDEKMKQHKKEMRKQEQEKEHFIEPDKDTVATDDHGQLPKKYSDASDSDAVSDAMARIGLSNDSLIGALASSVGGGTHPPSVGTHDFSNWSDAEKKEDDGSSESVTVASSVLDHNEMTTGGETEQDDHVYKKPYVEDHSE